MGGADGRPRAGAKDEESGPMRGLESERAGAVRARSPAPIGVGDPHYGLGHPSLLPSGAPTLGLRAGRGGGGRRPRPSGFSPSDYRRPLAAEGTGRRALDAPLPAALDRFTHLAVRSGCALLPPRDWRAGLSPDKGRHAFLFSPPFAERASRGRSRSGRQRAASDLPAPRAPAPTPLRRPPSLPTRPKPRKSPPPRPRSPPQPPLHPTSAASCAPRV